MDQIIIEDLEASFRVGAPIQERATPQRLLVTVTMDCDLAPAARTGNLAATIDYAAVVQRLHRLGAEGQWVLIESLAEEIAQLILREFKPTRVSILVKKFVIPETRWIAVKIERTNGAGSVQTP